MGKYYHSYAKKHTYFEGWYFKHQKDSETLAVIPGIHLDSSGHKSAFIQIITQSTSYYIPYEFSKVKIFKNKLYIQIGPNIFSSRGMSLAIHTPELQIKGTLHYGPFTPIRYDIMGPFKSLPFMECHHGIISMSHEIHGTITLNNRKLDFNQGIGYIEKDWGHSFPKSYIWTQCNYFNLIPSCSIVVSVAHIPFLGFHFNGCICVIHYKDKEYRLATYLGVKIIYYTQKILTLKQGPYTLQINFSDYAPQMLIAPQKGNMIRTIHENAACTIRYRFWIHDTLLFDLQSPYGSFEFVSPNSLY